MFPNAHRVRKLWQPNGEPLEGGFFQWTQVAQHLARFRRIPLAQLRAELEQPGQPVRTLEVRSSFPTQVRGLLFQVLRGEALAESITRRSGERRVRKCARQPNEQPVSMNRRMPVVAAVEGGCQFARRRDIRIAVQDVADLVRIFFVHAGERESRETFRGHGIELRRRTRRRGAVQREGRGEQRAASFISARIPSYLLRL